MATYAYKARDAQGRPSTGTVNATSEFDARRAIQRDGSIVIEVSLAEADVDIDALKTKIAARRVQRDEVIGLAAQLGVMIETGVPLSHALDAFIEQSRRRGRRANLAPVMQDVAARIASGDPFSRAMAKFPRVFPTLMVSLMEAAEASGSMGTMLGRISQYLGKERKIVKQIRGALAYPCMMLTLAFSITAFLVSWVLPRFARIYESREAALPKVTQIILAFSNFTTDHWPVLLGGLAAAVVGFFAFRASRSGRRTIDHFKVSAPVIGPMFTLFYLTRATRTLGTLMAAGVPVLDAVRIVRGVTNNVLWGDLWAEIEETVTAGRRISEVLLHSQLVPPAAAQMLAAGEDSGRLAQVLERVADTSEDDLDQAVKTATQLIEPAMIIVMGATIGFVAIALLLPIFSVASTMAN
ncbi:MAG: type II secretion system F family protein [Phycisphaerales bacterium]|nr:type II secretion system F family protein [Phycisphaerales bacterium]